MKESVIRTKDWTRAQLEVKNSKLSISGCVKYRLKKKILWCL